MTWVMKEYTCCGEELVKIINMDLFECHVCKRRCKERVIDGHIAMFVFPPKEEAQSHGHTIIQ